MVRLLRAVFNVPLSELAQVSGVSLRELSRLERNEVNPSKDTLNKLDQAFQDIIQVRALKATPTT